MSGTLKNFQQFEDFLARFTNYERVQFVKYDKATLGTARMQSLARELGEPHSAYPAVHVAGSKGKGSTSLLLEALLRSEGFSVGTYLSPHVEHLTERIRIDGHAIPEDKLLREVNAMLPVLELLRSRGTDAFPSFFELMTALAMTCFRTRKVDWAIFETGLGGRLDATNILEPRLCVITSIGLEHTQQLGTTIPAIAREKAGILKPGAHLILGPVDRDAEGVIRRIAEERGVAVTRVYDRAVRSAGPGRIILDEPPVSIDAGPVLGPALRINLALAVTALRWILRESGREPRRDRLSRALESTCLPARVEVFPGPPAVVLDSAHTPESVRALAVTLKELMLPRPRVLVFSIATGKELGPIVRMLPLLAEDWIFTRADPVRSVSPKTLRDLAGGGTTVELPENAFEQAMRRERPVIVTGSFYLAGRLRPLIRHA